jgi:hypothetical protein
VHAAEHPGERVLTSVLETVPGTADLLFLAAVRHNDAVLGHLPFLLGEPSSIFWPIWEGEESDDTDKDTDRTLDDEEPLPTVGGWSVNGLSMYSACLRKRAKRISYL